MTRIVTVAKAAGVAGEETQSVAIDISETLPPSHALPDLAAWDAYLDEQATKIEEALNAALPGGTYHHLLVKNAGAQNVPATGYAQMTPQRRTDVLAPFSASRG